VKYTYSNAVLPARASLPREIDLAAERLARKLTGLDSSALGISEYNQRYLGDIVRFLVDALQTYGYLLACSLVHKESSLKEFVLVDHGGGIGMLSLLAKELGIGTVIYNDIFDVSCCDARLVAKAISREADAYVCGEIDELLCFLQKYGISADAIVSNNVIEHIYDIEYFLKKLRFLSRDSLCVLFASSANAHNPRIVRKVRKMHLDHEYADREKVWGYKERDSLRSYLGIRREIISGLDPSLPVEVVERLAKATRGLRTDDIVQCVEEYKRTGSISYRADHPTNTCDPYTGNWCERLMDTEYIRALLSREGYDVQILGGYYGFSGRLHKRVMRGILNGLLSTFRSKGLLWAPYYVVYAQKKASSEDTTIASISCE
jgi:2-polyprenyl-3-methyl-5-hydroxy-6-metoxy-1,4-benzoquinol methylase